MNEKRARALEELGFVYTCAHQKKEKTSTLEKSNNQKEIKDRKDNRKPLEQQTLSDNEGIKKIAGSGSDGDSDGDGEESYIESVFEGKDEESYDESYSDGNAEESYVESEGEMFDLDRFHSCDLDKLFDP
eukprot:11030658-Ditylum_brightwellii.AAC.1